MTPKQRFEAAMRHQQPEEYVAFMEVEFHIYEDYVGDKLILGYEFEKLSSREKEKALHHNAEIMILTAEKAGHDAIRNLPGYWEISPGRPAFIWLPGEEAQMNQLKVLKKMAGDRYFLIGNSGGTMGIPDGEHLEQFVTELFDNPDDVKKRNENYICYGIENQWKVLDAGADGIMNCCDVAFNNGPFISPKMMDEFFFPYFNRWADSLNTKGIISIWHSDGNLMPIMDRILESGVSAIQCVDPLGGMDIVEVKKQVNGRLALIGNIDCSMLQFGPKEKIEEEVKRVVQGCKGNGGFVLCGCNAIFQGISAEHYQVMVDSRYKYGKET
jgi:uroporphyrinogen decarboxylase